MDWQAGDIAHKRGTKTVQVSVTAVDDDFILFQHRRSGLTSLMRDCDFTDAYKFVRRPEPTRECRWCRECVEAKWMYDDDVCKRCAKVLRETYGR